MEEMEDQQNKYMKTALKEAAKGSGKVSPNPLVGCVIVKNGTIIGKGYHRVYGGPHAEVNAINSCCEDPAGSDMYVTLEPCSHYGKTPPCTELIILKKIKRVFIGIIDPSHHSSGKGADMLKSSGLDVFVGICEKKCREINLPFFHFIKTGLPLVTIKTASSLDGSVATDSFDSKWITCEKSRKNVHRLRSVHDAVLVGKNTAEKDDPLLTVRNCRGRNPVRIVLDETLSLDIHKKIFGNESKTFIITSIKAAKILETKYKAKGISVVRVREINGELDLKQAFGELSSYGIRSILAEGGAALSGYLLRKKLADRIILFLAPRLIGSGVKFFTGSGFRSISESIVLEDVSFKRFGEDIKVEGSLRYSD
jgi:diaminohydroxyphosphoribosylaminopyrimidine deaminase/5-amino-6-(5-phosphoribosylamino)uracil reductase